MCMETLGKDAENTLRRNKKTGHGCREHSRRQSRINGDLLNSKFYLDTTFACNSDYTE